MLKDLINKINSNDFSFWKSISNKKKLHSLEIEMKNLKNEQDNILLIRERIKYTMDKNTSNEVFNPIIETNFNSSNYLNPIDLLKSYEEPPLIDFQFDISNSLLGQLNSEEDHLNANIGALEFFLSDIDHSIIEEIKIDSLLKDIDTLDDFLHSVKLIDFELEKYSEKNSRKIKRIEYRYKIFKIKTNNKLFDLRNGFRKIMRMIFKNLDDISGEEKLINSYVTASQSNLLLTSLILLKWIKLKSLIE